MTWASETIGTITLFNEDCIEVMRAMPDNAFDLAIDDPPYGINAPKDGGSNKKKGRLNTGSGKLKNRALNTLPCEWDCKAPEQDYFDELFRVSRNQIIWGYNYFNLPPTRGIVCWDKCQPWENFSQVELAWTSFDCPAKIVKISNTGGANREKKIHPTQKPVALYSWLLRHFAKEGDTILDTHGGSMSSMIACIRGGFEATCIELDEQFFKAARNRIEVESKQLTLF